MAIFSTERSLQVSPDHLSDSQYLGAKVQYYSRILLGVTESMHFAMLRIANRLQRHQETSGNQQDPTHCWSSFSRVSVFSKYTKQWVITGTLWSCMYSHLIPAASNYFPHAAGFCFAFFSLVFFL